MTSWELPMSIAVGGREYAIRTDFRVVLDVLKAVDDPELFEPDASEQEKSMVRLLTALEILVEDFDSLPQADYEAAYRQLEDFIDCGFKDDGKRTPRSMDWEQDAPMIIPAINRTYGSEIRALPYMHWWTFLGAYMEIGECLFSQVLAIRQKKIKHKKLEKWERDFYNANRDLIDLHKRLSEEQKKEIQELEKWL